MKTVLVIDDDEPVRVTYGVALEDQGYSVLTAASGMEGLELARRYLPDLILCDINMPGMDGRAVLQAVREDPDLGARQFVFMTGNTRDAMPRRGMELGADDFLIKPFTLEELSRCVAARLERARVHWRVEDRIVSGLRANLHSILPHEFFTPLNGILGLTEVLRGELCDLGPGEIDELLQGIEESGWRLHRALKNYLLLLDLERGFGNEGAAEARLEGAALESAVRLGLNAATRRHHREADVTLRLASAPILGTPAEVAMVVEELVDNACAYSRRGTPIELAISEDGCLTVSDRGRGLTDEQLAQVGVFQQFDRRRFEQQGLGLGLFLVHELAKRCGAEVGLESRFGEGTQARVKFRLAGPDPA